MHPPRPSFVLVLPLMVTLAAAQNPPSPAAPGPAPAEAAPPPPARPAPAGPGSEIPEPLKPWVDWVRRAFPERDCPPAYDAAETRLCLWPSRLQFDATPTGAAFSLEVSAFAPVWLGLPGGRAAWPLEVSFEGRPVPVVERDGRPAIHLDPGAGTVKGRFQWAELPQQIKVPPEIGLLALSIGGQAQPAPSWEKDGTLWLQRRASTEPVDEDFLSLTVHSLLEDGIPLWFETRIDLIVAGKSREAVLGTALPEGWQLASIDSPLPVAIDEEGKLKVQLRAGRWNVGLRAFRSGAAEAIGFAAGASPLAPDQVVAFQGNPAFRQAEVTGMPQVDVAQTQVPDAWRSLPVYRWDTAASFRLEERVRGPGERGKSPLAIDRSLWLDDDGRALTFQDRLSGPLHEIRRLDAARGHALGSVTAGGVPQLITHNPRGGSPGFEVRSPLLDATATGRIDLGASLPATGWQTGADRLQATLHLPPGYRLFALFGADFTDGDWLTAWSLLDIFLLLLFTLAVHRLRGWRAAALACLAFGLAYHEPGAPRVTWLLLLVPVALAGALPPGRWRNLAVGAKWSAAILLLLVLAPFAARQIQAALFPQLESTRSADHWFDDGLSPRAAASQRSAYEQVADTVAEAVTTRASTPEARKPRKASEDNLKSDPKAIIQTGPGVPAWTWRRVGFGWDGPVAETQEIRPVLIPPFLTRPLGVARVLCLVALAAVLLGRRRSGRGGAGDPSGADRASPSAPPASPAASPAASAAALLAVGAAMLALPAPARAQFPDQELLKELGQRLQEAGDAFPGAADLASAALRVEGGGFTLDLEYHAAARTAAPVPVPSGVLVPAGAAFADGAKATVLRREGQLWVLLPGEGIHRLTLEGRVAEVTDWEWGFSLKPRRIAVSATGWTVSGLRPDGTSEDQVLFSRADRPAAAAASYDRAETRHALLVEREIELGLVWRVRTTVRRLSPAGRSAALRVPLLPGEKVVSTGRTVEGGSIEVRLAPDAMEASWEGELDVRPEIGLATREGDSWTERWRLLASPVWNVSLSGLAPTFESLEGGQLAPLWQPWPGESASLEVSRPEAVPGAAVTIDSVSHRLNPGRRQRSSTLQMAVRTSLGEDFPIELPAGAEIVSLSQEGQAIPVRKIGHAVVVPLRPGSQTIQAEWRLPAGEGGWTRSDAVRLPVEAANVSTTIEPPRDRWPLFSTGPQQGPAFRFWGVLAFVLIAAVVLSRVPRSPVRLTAWLLLSIGLTQVPVFFSLVVVGWLFLIHWRGSEGYQGLPLWAYNLCQVVLIVLTGVVTLVFIGVASAGLIGDPEMYISGNGSTASRLNWFTARSGADLPQPGYWSVSVWWYRFAMLLWALWLAASLVRWLRTAWTHSLRGGHFRPRPPRAPVPPKPASPSPEPPELPARR